MTSSASEMNVYHFPLKNLLNSSYLELRLTLSIEYMNMPLIYQLESNENIHRSFKFSINVKIRCILVSASLLNTRSNSEIMGDWHIRHSNLSMYSIHKLHLNDLNFNSLDSLDYCIHLELMLQSNLCMAFEKPLLQIYKEICKVFYRASN